MIKYIIRRLVQSIPTFFGITLLSYLLLWLAPGSVVERLYFAPNIKAETRARLAAQLGIDDPFHIQYLRWVAGDDWLRWDNDDDGIADSSFTPIAPLDEDGDGIPEPPGDNYGILRGDFGKSFIKKQPVLEVILSNLAATLELGIAAILTSLVIGVPVGVVSAVTRGRLFDNVSRIMAVIFDSIPSFWLAYMLIILLGSSMKILPIGGRCGVTLTGVCPPLFERIDYLIMPTFVFAVGLIALFSRYLRTSTLEVLGQDYIRTARAKGLAPSAVNFRHAMRNALIPVATLLGPIITNVWAGAIVIETVFAWPGVGRIAYTSAIQQDYPVVMGIVIFASLATILGFLLSDVLYVLIDPRIRIH
ncbi:MAG: ABC transporter permease [Chloroflexota bacterium]|nr:ABC transporter permease [Chloroflexota bacterium]